MQHKDAEALEKHGGVVGLAKALRVSTDDGLDPAAAGDLSLARRMKLYGENKFATVPLKGFFSLLLDNLRDEILILLMVAATVRSPLPMVPPAKDAMPDGLLCLHGSLDIIYYPQHASQGEQMPWDVCWSWCSACMAQVSTVLGVAMPEERAQGGWTEGVAIWVAVIVVSLVGERLFPLPDPLYRVLSNLLPFLTACCLH